MIYKFQYKSNSERESIIATNDNKFLIEEQNIKEGNFLIFSDEPLPEKVVYVNIPEKELELLKAQNQANSDRADFIEDVIAEMAMNVYQ